MFYELGIDVLMNFSGHLCFITPKFWMLNLEDEQMRKTFSCNLEIKQIAFCNPPFIYSISKSKPKCNTKKNANSGASMPGKT